jgi:GNAT superfamily N-acetyltransferase
MDDLAARVQDAQADMWEYEGRLRAGVAELRGIRLMASGLPQPQWNNGDVTAADADVEGARAFFAERGVPWGVRVPVGIPWDRGRHLFRKRLMGLPAGEHRPAPAVPGLVVREADRGDAGAVVRIDATAFEEDPAVQGPWVEPHIGAPGCTVALGELAGEPVATALGLRTDGRAGPCLCIGGVAVLPHARRRGIAAALTSWLLERGFAAGAELAHLHPDDDDAARLYGRLGFVETAGFDVYVEL